MKKIIPVIAGIAGIALLVKYITETTLDNKSEVVKKSKKTNNNVNINPIEDGTESVIEEGNEESENDPHYDPMNLQKELSYKVTSAKVSGLFTTNIYPAAVQIDVNTRGTVPLWFNEKYQNIVNEIITDVIINKLYHKDITKYFADDILNGYYSDIYIRLKTAVRSSTEVSNEFYTAKLINSSYVQKALEKRFSKCKDLVHKMIQECTKKFFEEDLDYISITDYNREENTGKLVFLQSRYNDHMLFFNAMSLFDEKGFINHLDFEKTFDSCINEGIYKYYVNFESDNKDIEGSNSYNMYEYLSTGNTIKPVNIDNKFEINDIDLNVESYSISIDPKLYKEIKEGENSNEGHL